MGASGAIGIFGTAVSSKLALFHDINGLWWLKGFGPGMRDDPPTVADCATGCIAEAHARWNDDCVKLEWELANLGMSFGANGYRRALERGAIRLDEGVNRALALVTRRASPTETVWQVAH